MWPTFRHKKNYTFGPRRCRLWRDTFAAMDWAVLRCFPWCLRKNLLSDFSCKGKELICVFGKMVWFDFIIGPCEQECLKAKYTVHQTNSMADSFTLGLTPHWNFSACCWEIKAMPSISWLCDLGTVPGFFFFPKDPGYQQIVATLLTTLRNIYL